MKELRVFAEFQEEARAETRRQDIQVVLEIKFGPPAAKEFVPALRAFTDSKRLARVFRLVVRCSSLEQFRDRFPKSARQLRRRR